METAGFFSNSRKLYLILKLKARRIPEHFSRLGLICTLSYDVINLILLVLFFTDVNQTTCIECSEGKALNLSCKDSIRQVPCSSQCFTAKGNITYFYKPDEVITTAIEERGCANCTGKYIKVSTAFYEVILPNTNTKWRSPKVFVLLRNDYMRTGKIRHKRSEEIKNQTVIIMATKIMEDNKLGKVTVTNLIMNHHIPLFGRQEG